MVAEVVPDDGADEAMSSPDEVRLKERERRIARVTQRLGWRVVYLHKGHSYSSGIQVQHIVNGKVTNVRPGDRLDWMMWLLLTNPEEEWDEVFKRAGLEQ